MKHEEYSTDPQTRKCTQADDLPGEQGMQRACPVCSHAPVGAGQGRAAEETARGNHAKRTNPPQHKGERIPENEQGRGWTETCIRMRAGKEQRSATDADLGHVVAHAARLAARAPVEALRRRAEQRKEERWYVH